MQRTLEIYTDWANHHLEKTGVKRLIQDLPKDISDGVLLAEIAEFACGTPVERIYSTPSTTKQKLHNIERCLHVLEANRVVLNDVNVQGLYRGELKCVLALFFHLSRHKQKELDFKMADPNKPGQRRCLRPPSTVGVGRKSRSFNANDKNRINSDVSNNEAITARNVALTTEEPQDDLAPLTHISHSNPPPGAGSWRSKSMSAKHTATSKLVVPKTPKAAGNTLQTFKPDVKTSGVATGVTSRVPESSQNLVGSDHKKASTVTTSRIGSPSRLQRGTRKPPTSLNVSEGKLKPIEGSYTSTNMERVTKSALTKPSGRRSVPVSKVASPNRTLEKRVVKHFAPSPTSEELPARETESKISLNGGVRSTSMISRLKKLGSATSVSSSTTSTKPRTTSASKKSSSTVTSSLNNTLKKRSGSCPPTSRLSTGLSAAPPQNRQANIEKLNSKERNAAERSSLKSPSGLKSVKSTLGKAFSSAKQNDKKKSPTSPVAKSGAVTKANRKSSGISKSEIRPIIPMVTNADEPVQKIQSHTNGTYEESDKLANVIFTDLPTATDVTKPPISTSADPSAQATSSTNTTKPTNSICFGTSLPRTPSKAHKTATVAPFNRQTTPVQRNSAPTITHNLGTSTQTSKDSDRKSLELKSEDVAVVAATTPAEAKEIAVKGIADLRQNLEETMSSLRNTQLRHRKGDDFQRRISAQLDGVQLDEINKTFSDAVPLSCSGAVYRSHHNLVTSHPGACTPLYGSGSPKLHAGETLGHHAEYKFGPGRFSSLQRTRSARYARPPWREINVGGYCSDRNPLAANDKDMKGYASDGAILSGLDSLQVKDWDKNNETEEGGSGSSCDLSDYIGDVSTDELSSNNSSPQHHMKTPIETEREGTSWKRLGAGLSKSTMAIEISSKSVKLAKKKNVGKPPFGLRAPGSSIVGSRLACNDDTTSPSASPSLGNAGCRGTFSYRSLPRPNKSKIDDDKSSLAPPLASNVPCSNIGGKSSNFKRSPSLQKLFNFTKSKQNLADASTSGNSPVVLSNPHVTSSPTKSTISSATYETVPQMEPAFELSRSYDSTSPFRRDFSHYSSLGRPNKSLRQNTPHLSYLSLPRRSKNPLSVNAASGGDYLSRPQASTMTWSPPKRPNANSAYSISPATSNPYMNLDLLSTPSLNLDDKNSVNYATPDTFFKDADPEDFARSVSDWPLPPLVSTPDVTPSKPTMSEESSSVRSKDLSTSSKDFFRDNQKNKSDASHMRSNRRSSTVSTTPSLYALAEETVPPEKLKLEALQVETDLQTQLDTRVQVVTAFEENLSNMSDHFRKLSASAEEKDSELQELRATIETMKRNNSPDEWSNLSSGLKKKASCGSLTSISSKASVSSFGSAEDGSKKKKKHWLRESLKTAFGKRKSRPNLTTDLDEGDSPSDKPSRENDPDSDVVAKLKEELLIKERKLTDIRLEALTSQHQLHQMQDAMHKMRSEIETLRQENDRLNKLGLSSVSLNSFNRGNDVSSSYLLIGQSTSGERKMTVMVEYPDHMIHDDTDERALEQKSVLGVCYVARSINWHLLDEKIQEVFQNFCRNVAPSSELGLHSDAIASYTVGEASRCIGGDSPDLLPCAYIIGSVDSITVKLKDGRDKSADALALELLIDKDTVEKYASLLLDHGRVMLCGPAGTGKSILANRLAEHVVRMIPKRPGRDAVVRLDLKQRNEKEIAEYLHRLSEDCSKPESCGKDIPVVLVLDDLHRSTSLKEAFVPLLATAAPSQLPYLIGVAEQNYGSGLELHHEFRWILCSNHTPPVRDFLRRSLRRALCSWETIYNNNDTTSRIVEWLPACWEHINKCIESFNSADVTLGPRMFLSCPMDSSQSAVWFTDLWNFSLVPYIIQAVKQGGKRRSANLQWKDPLDWVKVNWPWTTSCDLLPIRAEDVAMESSSNAVLETAAVPSTSQPSDPLLNMLLKLQEAAITNYESDTSHDDSFERSLDRALGDLA